MYSHYLLAAFACKIMIKLYLSIFVSRCYWDEEKSICVNTARRRRRCCPSWLRAVAVHWSLRRHRQDLKQWLQQRTLLTGRRQWRGNTTESNEIVSLVLCVYWPRFYAILSCQSEKKNHSYYYHMSSYLRHWLFLVSDGSVFQLGFASSWRWRRIVVRARLHGPRWRRPERCHFGSTSAALDLFIRMIPLSEIMHCSNSSALKCLPYNIPYIQDVSAVLYCWQVWLLVNWHRPPTVASALGNKCDHHHRLKPWVTQRLSANRYCDAWKI